MQMLLFVMIALWAYLVYRYYLMRAVLPSRRGKILAVAGGISGYIFIMALLPVLSERVLPSSVEAWFAPEVIWCGALGAVVVGYLYEWTLAGEMVDLRTRLKRAFALAAGVFIAVWFVWTGIFHLHPLLAWLSFLVVSFAVVYYWARIFLAVRNSQWSQMPRPRLPRMLNKWRENIRNWRIIKQETKTLDRDLEELFKEREERK